MSFVDLYSSGEHRRNLAHFAAIASLAAVDGEVSKEEKLLLDRFADKLNISPEEYKTVMKKENKYPIDPPISSEHRLERLFDLFQIIFADHEIDEQELSLVKKYAIGLGFNNESADKVIKRSIAIFKGRIDFEDYRYLVQR